MPSLTSTSNSPAAPSARARAGLLGGVATLISITIGIPGSMMAEAGLSFLGLGITPPMTSWGQMMGLYQAYIQTSWHLTVFPALVLSLTMLAWFVLGDAMRDAFDPTIQV